MDLTYYTTTPENISFLGKKVFYPEDADIIVFTGGSDISPQIYDQHTGIYTHPSKLRDKKEVAIFNMYPDKAKLGICRGHQLLSVLAGAKLIQHVNNHHMPHSIKTFDNRSIVTTSVHHQMVNTIGVDTEDYFLIGWAGALSTTYLDGDDKEVVVGTSTLLKNKYYEEPEIIYWPKIKAITTQGHPEYSTATKEYKDYILDLCIRLVDGNLDDYLIEKDAKINSYD